MRYATGSSGVVALIGKFFVPQVVTTQLLVCISDVKPSLIFVEEIIWADLSNFGMKCLVVVEPRHRLFPS